MINSISDIDTTNYTTTYNSIKLDDNTQYEFKKSQAKVEGKSLKLRMAGVATAAAGAVGAVAVGAVVTAAIIGLIAMTAGLAIGLGIAGVICLGAIIGGIVLYVKSNKANVHANELSEENKANKQNAKNPLKNETDAKIRNSEEINKVNSYLKKLLEVNKTNPGNIKNLLEDMMSKASGSAEREAAEIFLKDLLNGDDKQKAQALNLLMEMAFLTPNKKSERVILTQKEFSTTQKNVRIFLKGNVDLLKKCLNSKTESDSDLKSEQDNFINLMKTTIDSTATLVELKTELIGK